MAHIATHTTSVDGGLVSRLVTSFWNGLMAISQANHLSRQVEALMALSDKELAARGLKREEIARHVFSTSYWI